MNYYNDAVMMAYQLGIWERVPENGSQHAKRRESGPFRLRAAPKATRRSRRTA